MHTEKERQAAVCHDLSSRISPRAAGESTNTEEESSLDAT